MEPLLWMVGYLAIATVVAYLIARFIDEDAAPLSLIWPLAPIALAAAVLLGAASLGNAHKRRSLKATADGEDAQ